MDTTIQYNTTSSWKAELSLALRSPGAACVAAYVLLCYVLMSTVWAKQYWRPLPGEFIDDGSQWVKDPRVDVPFHDETVPYFPHLTIISYGIPLAVLVLRGFLTHRAAGDVRAFLYAFFPAMATTNLANTWIKRYVGRLRPFFYQRCGYDASTFACTDDKDLVIDVKPVCMTFEDFYCGFTADSHPAFSVSPYKVSRPAQSASP